MRSYVLATTLVLVCVVGQAAAQPTELKIGFCGALSGRAQAYGRSVKQGTELAVQRINAAGGIRGLSLVLVALDDEQTETVTSERVTALVYTHQCQAIIGTTDSGCTHVAARICLKAKVPLLATVATDPTLTRLANPYVFRNLADDLIQGRALVDYLARQRNLRRFAIAHVNTRYGRGGARVVETAARLLNSPVVKRWSFETGQTDFNAIVAELRSLRPDGLVIWGLYAEGAALTRAIRDGGLTVPIFGPDGLAAAAFIAQAGVAADRVVVTYPFDPGRTDDPLVADFVRAFTDAYGTPPDSFAAHAYDAVYQIAEAARSTGLDGPAIRDGLARMRDFHGVTGVFSFDASGNSTLPVFLAVVENGVFKVLRQP